MTAAADPKDESATKSKAESPTSTAAPERDFPDPNDAKIAESADSIADITPPSIYDNFGAGKTDQFKIGPPQPGGSVAGPEVEAGLRQFYAQRIEWESCTDYRIGMSEELTGTVSKARFSCGYGIVPLNYDEPDGPTVAVALTRLSVGDQKKKGTIFVNPGGPGGSGMGIVWNLEERLYELGMLNDYDVIGFDPRGVGSSAPSIQCISSAYFDFLRETAQAPEDNMKNCVRDTARGFEGIDSTEFLRNVGTNNVVKDLDVFRSAVGDARLNYLGYSYGTTIGYAYAQQFPERIRTMVIDAITNPFQNNPEVAEQYSEFTQNDEEENDEVFQRLAEECVENDGFEFGGRKVPCALGDDVDLAKEEFAKIADLAKSPIWSVQKKRWISTNSEGGGEIDGALRMAKYSERLWPTLNAGLDAVKNGEDPADIINLSDMYFDRAADGSYRDNGTAKLMVIRFCADQELGFLATLLYCPDGNIRASEPLAKGRPIKALTNILAIAGTYDNATPYSEGVVAAKASGATLVSVASNSHGSYMAADIECVDQLTTNYFRTLRVYPTPGKEGVDTKDIYSKKTISDQCQVDTEWRPEPRMAALDPAAGGEQLRVRGTGLTFGGLYRIELVDGAGRPVLFAPEDLPADASGTLSATIAVPEDFPPGTYTARIRGVEDITAVLEPATSAVRITAAEDPAQPDDPKDDEQSDDPKDDEQSDDPKDDEQSDDPKDDEQSDDPKDDEQSDD
ncbi:alpha/beta fold hydrolase, partial [Microlunatus sp. GCM10028923]|uniref:alpha/beta fold hydrolase n=1 Tax=Microlunatus sp. GCM10028923 TaxID=3273400 RepID=UPI003618BA19